MHFTRSQFDKTVNGTQWQSSFHRTMAVICLCGNSRVKTEDQLLRNVEIINSVGKGETTVVTIENLLDRGCDFAKGD
jgi:hypothetical protein